MMPLSPPHPAIAARARAFWWQPTPERLRRLSWLLVFLTFDLILFGAFTRLTDSGLGCPDWPGCYGNLSPLGARHEIAQAQATLPSGPVTHVKAWIEMLHRYLATFVGALIVLKLVWVWMHSRGAARAVALPLLTLVWVCVQGAFGALTVTMRLFPLIVSLHLLAAMVLLVLLVLQLRDWPRNLRALGMAATGGRKVAIVWLCAFVLLWVQIALGAWVSANYAVLACSDFPGCAAGVWVPQEVDAQAWREGFAVWRELGKTQGGESAELLSFAALQAIHLSHRAVAVALTFALVWLIWQIRAISPLRAHKRTIEGLLVLQLLTGVSNAILGWPLFAALLHTGGAAGMVVAMVLIGQGVNWRQSPQHHDGLC